MKKLLSLPPNLVNCFHDVTGHDRSEWFCTNDPIGHKLGSGGGSTWLLEACYAESSDGKSFDEWLASDCMPADRAAGCRPTPRRARC